MVFDLFVSGTLVTSGFETSPSKSKKISPFFGIFSMGLMASFRPTFVSRTALTFFHSLKSGVTSVKFSLASRPKNKQQTKTKAFVLRLIATCARVVHLRMLY